MEEARNYYGMKKETINIIFLQIKKLPGYEILPR